MPKIPAANWNPVLVPLSILLLLLVIAAAGGALFLFLAALTILLILSPLLLLLWSRLYGERDIADGVFYAPTPDGWRIALHFHRPARLREGVYPVIFSHGIAVNKYGVDLDHAHSLAAFLKMNGYPVFVPDLRSTGKSRHPIRRGADGDFSLDEIIANDVGAMIDRVCELTGAKKVNWIGHSMGAIIACGYLGRRIPGHERIASLVSLGGPGRLDYARRSFWGFLARHPWLSRLLNLRFLARLLAPLAGRLPISPESIFYNREVVRGDVIRRLMQNGIENIAPGLANQFIDWITSGKQTSRDGKIDYAAALTNIKAPALFIAGERDRVAPPRSVAMVYKSISSKKKRFVALGRPTGLDIDYCHTGLVLGDRALTDVFPLVLQWLEQNGRSKKRGVAGHRTSKRGAARSRLLRSIPLILMFIASGFGCHSLSDRKPTIGTDYFRTDFRCHRSVTHRHGDKKYGKAYTRIRGIYGADTARRRHAYAVLTGDSTAMLFAPSLLKETLPEFDIANRGIGGDTSEMLLRRIDDDVLILKPRIIIIAIGGNDLLLGRCLGDILKTIRTIVGLIRTRLPGTEIVLTSVPPVVSWKANTVSPYFNRQLEYLAQETSHTHFLDLWPALAVDNPPGLNEAYRIPLPDDRVDAVHFNVSGYRRWADLLRPLLNKRGK